MSCSINYYNDFIKATKSYRKATEAESAALNELKDALSQMAKDSLGSDIQNKIFEIGKNHGYEEKMKDWFSALYQILLGQDKGPRMGSFVALYGIDNFVKLIEEKDS